MPQGPFDAVIAIGVLIKGSTMHFEYICDSVYAFNYPFLSYSLLILCADRMR